MDATEMKGKRRSILVVDEDELLADLLGEFLNNAGFVVLTALGARGALDSAQRNDLDLVLTDLNLRGSSGFELLERFSERSLPTPVVLMSASLDDATQSRARQLGACATIGKPFHNDQLLDLIHRVLEPSTVTLLYDDRLTHLS